MAILQVLLFISNISCSSAPVGEHHCAETRTGRVCVTNMQVLEKT